MKVRSYTGRLLLLLAGLGSLGVLASACNEQSLRSLDPDFRINWPEEWGYDTENFGEGGLIFGTVTTGDVADIPVQVSNPGTAPLEVCRTYLATAEFDENGDLANEIILEADSEIAWNGPTEGMLLDNGQVLELLLRFTPLYGTPIRDDLYLVVQHELNYDCDDGEGVGLYIPILGEGFGEPVPDIHSEPGQIEFPDLEVGQLSAVYDVRITNVGPALLTVDDVALADSSHFTIVTESVTGAELEYGDNALMSVQFSPTGEGSHSTEIVIGSNDPDEDPYTIPLIGIANASKVGKGPQAVCAPGFDSAPFETENFDGSDSYDPDGLTLTFQWVLTPPAGSASNLNSYTVPTPSITLDLAGNYVGNLTVTNTNGQSDSCSQTISAIPNENFRVELFWGVPDDMDLHVLRPDSQGGATPHSSPGDCYYANTNPDWGVAGNSLDDPSLDLDDIPGIGPENINIEEPAMSPMDGWYEVFVHDYPYTEIYEPANDVTVNIYLDGVLADTFNFTMSGEDADYYVAKIHWPTGAIDPCSGLGGC